MCVTDDRGSSWGLSHFTNAASDWNRNHAVLTRFDCDLSLDVNDPLMKESDINVDPEVYFKYGLTKEQRKRIEAAVSLKEE